MTLDHETAEQVARSILWAGEVGSERIVRAVQAGYAHRDAEVEELRAERDRLAQREAIGIDQRGTPYWRALAEDAIAERNVLRRRLSAERETPAEGWEYRPGRIGADGRARITSPATIAPDYVREYMAEGGEVVRRRVGPWEEVVPDDRA